MKSKKKEGAPSRFTRGERVSGAKRRHARKPGGEGSKEEGYEQTRKTEDVPTA